MKRVTVYYTRNKKGKPHFSLQRARLSVVCGYYSRDEHPEGTGMIFYQSVASWTTIPQPTNRWLASHRPQNI